MEYYKSGRFGRITKGLIKFGNVEQLDEILYDSNNFPKKSRKQKADYVEEVISRMETTIGTDETVKVMRHCGDMCCGKSWSNFVDSIYKSTNDLTEFFELLNIKEEEFNTKFDYNDKEKTIRVERTTCICGLVNKAKRSFSSNLYCECSAGHFKRFFETVFEVKTVVLEESILAGKESCVWIIQIENRK